MIGSHVSKWNLDEEPLFEFFHRRGLNLNAALFVHPWDVCGDWSACPATSSPGS